MLSVGDVFTWERRLVVTYRVNQSSAWCVPLEEKLQRSSQSDPAKQEPVDVYPYKNFHLSQNTEAPIVARLGDGWRDKNFASEVPGFAGGRTKQKQPQSGDAEEKDMEKTIKKKKSKATKAKDATAANGGNLKKIMGNSVCSVIRTLKRDGLTNSHVGAIVVAQGVKVGATTVAGIDPTKKDAKYADLTMAQIKELRESAKDPAEAEAKAA